MSFAERPLDEWQSHADNSVEAAEHAAAETISQSATKATAAVWGWLPALSVVHAGGLMLISLANVWALSFSSMSNVLFWLGLAIMLIPTAMRLVAGNVSRQERIGLVISLGMALYLVKLVHSPFGFTYGDEFFHLFNTNMILENQTLFTPNSELTVSPLFPGLPSLTASIATLTGLSVFQSGVIVIGVARLLLVVSLFLFAEQVSRSPRVAGLTALFFMCNSNFLYWSAQFAYESLSFPLVIGAFFLIARRERAGRRSTYMAYTLLTLLTVSAIVITHHISSYFMVAFLFGWWALVRFEVHLNFQPHLSIVNQWRKGQIDTDVMVEALGSREKRMSLTSDTNVAPVATAMPTGEELTEERGPEGIALFSFILALAWLTYVAITTYGYISGVISRAGLSLVDILTGSEQFRQLFASADGYDAPLLERIVTLTGVALSLIGLPFGLQHFWRHYRQSAVAWILATGAVSYFAMLPMRLTTAGWQTGNRASVYFYLGLAFVLALAADKLWTERQRFVGGIINRTAIFGVIFIMIFASGVVAGWNPQNRFAKPVVVDAGGELIEAQGMNAALWMRETLGTNHNVVTDEANGRLMLAYGEQYGYAGRFPFVYDILRTPTFTPKQLGAMQSWDLNYAVVDRRESVWNPMAGYFFDPVNDEGNPTVALTDPLITQKFDRQPLVSRIMDAGTLVIYDVNELMAVARRAAAGEVLPPALANMLLAGSEVTPAMVNELLESGAISEEKIKAMIADGEIDPSQINPALLPEGVDLNEVNLDEVNLDDVNLDDVNLDDVNLDEMNSAGIDLNHIEPKVLEAAQQ